MNEKIFVTKTSMPSYEEYIEKIKPLWESHWLTNMGIYHKELEARLKEYLRVPHVSLMVNGHLALELAIQAMNFPEGSEVITTPFTFVSTTHAIVRNRLKPVFCDIKEDDYTIDENKIEELITDKTVAIVPVHVYGNICNIKAIEEIAKRHDLKVIYDAAHAFGESLDGVGIANMGDASTFSFHATKVFNTIEGGAVTFRDAELYEKLYNLKNFGIRGEEEIESVGANAKMNEFAAIMGLCNLEHIDQYIEERKRRAELYISQMANNERIVVPKFSQPGVQYNYAYFPVRFLDGSRDEVYNKLRENNIFARKYFYPLTSDAECYESQYKEASLEIARKVSDSILVLPLYPELEDDVIFEICNCLTMTFEGGCK